MTAVPHRPIRFFHRGAVQQVPLADPTRTVLQWLREDAQLTGTKEGCAEGDCGACTVVLGELDDTTGGLRLKPVNACIQFLPTLDGKALFTVEDVGGSAGRPLHPVQQALVDCHGSQCGFCTPGFVMSLWACWLHHTAAGTRPSRQQLADELSGNLCRCTGYRPIIDAGERMFALTPATPLDEVPLVAALQSLQAAAPLAADGAFHAPRSAAELGRLRAAKPQALLLAGGTDVGLWVTKQLKTLPEIIYTGNVAELRQVELDDEHIRIGAAVPLEDAWRTLVAEWPELHELWLRFASPPVRWAGTLGGNVANGSPIGDAPPVLMALGAHVVLQRGDTRRRVALDAFYTAYQRNCMEPGEFLREVAIPRRRPGQLLCAYKISKRFDSDISALCGALTLVLDGERIAEVRVAFGGMAATVKRAAATEAALLGERWDEDAVQRAQQALGADFKPLSDLRASSAYRLQVAQNLLRRAWLQTRPADPLPASALTVWARA